MSMLLLDVSGLQAGGSRADTQLPHRDHLLGEMWRSHDGLSLRKRNTPSRSNRATVVGKRHRG
jgi:hypothetical protein